MWCREMLLMPELANIDAPADDTSTTASTDTPVGTPLPALRSVDEMLREPEIRQCGGSEGSVIKPAAVTSPR